MSNKLQTPEEILKDQLGDIPHQDFQKNQPIASILVKECIKEAQRQAVHYALEKAAEEAETNSDEGGELGTVNKQSILSLESQILKDLGYES